MRTLLISAALSTAAGAALAQSADLPDNLKPTAEFTLPIGARPLAPPAKRAPGAQHTAHP